MGTLSSADLMEAVERGLNRLFPGEPVYWDYLPKDFKRPCFTLECPRTAGNGLNAALVQREADILATCWAAVDAYGDSSRKELTRRQSAVMSLFGQGFLRVKDRAVKVSGEKGAQTPEFAEVTGLFSWVDERPAYTDGADIPKMEHFEINKEEIK